MIKKVALALCLAVVTDVYSFDTVWNIGNLDGRADEFALAPDKFKDFLSKDFGYEDKFFVIGKSSINKDFPYILPGPVDTWGGTWPTSGWRTHEVNLLFDVADKPESGDYKLVVNLADFAKEFLPLVKVSVNNLDYKVQLSAPGYDVASQRKPSQTEKVQESGALEPVLSQNITQSQMPINNQLITIIIKSKYYRISLAISIFGCIFGCRISNTPSHEHQTKHHFCT